MVPAGNKAKRRSSVNHTTKTISFINCFIDLFIQRGALSSKTTYLLGTKFLKTFKTHFSKIELEYQYDCQKIDDSNL